MFNKEIIASNEYNWIIIEPSDVAVVPGCSAKYIHQFWDEKMMLDSGVNYDVLIHTHVFEHVLDVDGFMRVNAKYVRTGQRMIFSVPNLKETLKRKYTNALNFEHTFFLSDDYIEYLLYKYKFKIIKKELFREEHSIFYCTEKDESMKLLPELEGTVLYVKNRKLFEDYVLYHQNLVNTFNQRMKNTNKPVFLFGAHIFSQYLLKFGLIESHIINILDNDELKQGKRLYGTNLRVCSPKVLKQYEAPVVILKVASYADEIKQDIIDNINANTEFWE